MAKLQNPPPPHPPASPSSNGFFVFTALPPTNTERKTPFLRLHSYLHPPQSTPPLLLNTLPFSVYGRINIPDLCPARECQINPHSLIHRLTDWDELQSCGDVKCCRCCSMTVQYFIKLPTVSIKTERVSIICCFPSLPLSLLSPFTQTVLQSTLPTSLQYSQYSLHHGCQDQTRSHHTFLTFSLLAP